MNEDIEMPGVPGEFPELNEGLDEESYNFPNPIEQGSLYDLFKRVLMMPTSSKVGNLDRIELGTLPYSVRDCQKIAELARMLGHPKFGEYFERLAEIILKTSSSKKGWFTELFVSQKKFSKSGVENLMPNQGRSRWNMFQQANPAQQ